MAELALRTPYEREQMRERLASKRDEDIADAQRRRMNEGFVQVYPKGWARMRELLRETKSQAPLLLYTFIAEHIDADGGVLVADQETICEAIGVSRTTLWRAITFLEERNALLRIVVGGSVSAYALDPTEIWRSWDNAKRKGRVLNTDDGSEVVSKRRDQAASPRDDEGADREPELPGFDIETGR